jgi:hypothetical protein
MNVRARPRSEWIAAVLAGLSLGVAAGSRAEDTAPAAAPAARQAARAAATADAEPAATLPAPGEAQPAGAATATAHGKATAGARAGAGKGVRAMDTLELETTQITGNRELPKVMVVVPWKRSDIGDLVGRPVNSLVNEALAPVDRDVFRREIAYYGALAPDQQRNETPVTPGAKAAPAAKPEK